MKTEACRGCGAPIVWAVTNAGARAPINAEPDPDAAIGFTLREEPGGVYATFVRREHAPADREIHTSHFSNCPERDKFRRKR